MRKYLLAIEASQDVLDIWDYIWNYGVSLFYCMSAIVADGGPAYGAAIKGSEVKMLGEKAGFKNFRRLAVSSPFDALYEFKAD